MGALHRGEGGERQEPSKKPRRQRRTVVASMPEPRMRRRRLALEDVRDGGPRSDRRVGKAREDVAMPAVCMLPLELVLDSEMPRLAQLPPLLLPMSKKEAGEEAERRPSSSCSR